MYNVLIVEDDPMVAMINGQYVSRNKKFRVAGSLRDGKSALEFLQKEDVDLVILDVYMPHMDGLETLRKMREQGFDVSAIMVTAANDKDSIEEALGMGVVDYLVKPFAFDRFQLALEKFAARADELCGTESFDQNRLDRLLTGKTLTNSGQYPKGIQKETCDTILEYMRLVPDSWLSGDEIASKTGLSSVTVRRYMNHLAKRGEVAADMNYETGGRPCMLYKICM